MKRWWKLYYQANRERVSHLTMAQITTHFNVFVRRSSKAGGGRVKGRATKHVVRKWFRKSVEDDPAIKKKFDKPEDVTS